MTVVWIGFSAKTVANYLLELGKRDGVPIDPLKLQKLVYLAHGWSLVFLQRPLIKDAVEAWRFGPVVPALYREFKRFGASPITDSTAVAGPAETLDADSRALIDAVWDRYKALSPIQLSMFTHERGYAWDLARQGADFPPWDGPVIPNELIADEFTRRQQR